MFSQGFQILVLLFLVQKEKKFALPETVAMQEIQIDIVAEEDITQFEDAEHVDR